MSVSGLALVSPAAVNAADALAYRREHADNNERILHGGAFFEQYATFGEWLGHVRDCSEEATVRQGLVPSDVFFVARESDGALVGMLDVRRRLNDFLQNYGGHIGYGVRPSERRKGYGEAILGLGLLHCRAMGLEKVMVCCKEANAASARVIEKHGGVLERRCLHPDGDPAFVFWINVAALAPEK